MQAGSNCDLFERITDRSCWLGLEGWPTQAKIGTATDLGENSEQTIMDG
jgi:hypothetical protein